MRLTLGLFATRLQTLAPMQNGKGNVVTGTWVSSLRDLARNGDGNRDLRGRKILGYTVRCLIFYQI